MATVDAGEQGQTLPSATVRTRSRRTWWIIGGVAVVVLLALAYLGVGAYIADQFTHTNHRRETSTPASVGLTFDNVTFPSRDGVKLAGWYIPAPGATSAIVMVHGYTSNRTAEFGGHFLEAARALHDHGYNIFMINLRGHGESEGDRFSLGAKERLDVLGAVDWLQAKGISKIGALGVSMGAAATAEAAVDPNRGDGIKAVVLDSVFADSYDPVQREFSSTTGLPTWLLPGARLMAQLMYGVDIAGVRPAQDLPKIKAPVMLVYGTADTTVPPDQQQIVLAARPDAESWVVPGATHARIYLAQPDEYNKRLFSFFDRTLGAPQTAALPIEQTWLARAHATASLRGGRLPTEVISRRAEMPPYPVQMVLRGDAGLLCPARNDSIWST
ncbi:MAG: alpha/beta fold hydrolase [Anaerolineae bacterium]